MELLLQFSWFRSGDPRDKVFALWGLIDPSTPMTSLIRPNYHTSVEEVYLHTAIYVIKMQRRLDIIHSHYHESSSGSLSYPHQAIEFHREVLLSLPSWVPDWRKPLVNTLANLGVSVGSHRWLQEKHRGKVYNFTDEEFGRVAAIGLDNRTLRVKAFKLGNVIEIVGTNIFPCPSIRERTEFRRSFIEWVDLISYGPQVLAQYLRFLFRDVLERSNTLDVDDLTSPFRLKLDLDEYVESYPENITWFDRKHVQFEKEIFFYILALIGSNDLLGFSRIRPAIEAMLEEDGAPQIATYDLESVHEFLMNPGHGEVALSRWWPTFCAVFNTDPGAWGPTVWREVRSMICGMSRSSEEKYTLQMPQKWLDHGKFGYTFFLVQGYGLGVCPPCVKPESGDVVAKLAALAEPVILRPMRSVSNKKTVFTLVGECFVVHSQARTVITPELASQMEFIYLI